MSFNISNYLKKTLQAGDNRLFMKLSVLAVIKEVVGVELENKDVQFKDTTILIKKSPAFRSTVAIKKVEILKKINERVGEGKIFDIK